ncbi:MAG TPA: hypothetical protein VGP33_17360 [Chloroflexota bacterium]|jgi:hypothetical protein|nr:hypothetical protein [Chloroflexota bacterium]
MPSRFTRRQVLATALLAWLGLPTLASADVEWCYDDPPVLVRLPSGAPVNLNVRIRVPTGRREQLKAASVVGMVVDNAGEEAIQVTALVPPADAEFPVQITVGSRKESVNATQTGVAGMPVVFLLPIPSA